MYKENWVETENWAKANWAAGQGGHTLYQHLRLFVARDLILFRIAGIPGPCFLVSTYITTQISLWNVLRVSLNCSTLNITAAIKYLFGND